MTERDLHSEAPLDSEGPASTESAPTAQTATGDSADEQETPETGPVPPEFDGPIIGGRGICKTFGSTEALAGFEIEVGEGEIHGFLGPNGAGKTTFLRILLGLAQRDEGVLTVMGLDPWQDSVQLHRFLAYVPGDLELWPQLTGGETIDLLLRMRKVVPTRRDELVERFELDPSKKVRTYSKGNRQKVVLIAALAADVPLYLMDEPTDGLDPLMAQAFRDCVTERRAEGATILLSSHIMSEVEAIADRITLIRNGRTVESGSLTELRHLSRMQITATTARPVAGLADNPHVHDYVIEGDRLTCDVGPAGLPAVLAAVQSAGPLTLDCRPPSLEEVFLRHYGADSRDVSSSGEGGSGGDESRGDDADDPEPVISLRDRDRDRRPGDPQSAGDTFFGDLPDRVPS